MKEFAKLTRLTVPTLTTLTWALMLASPILIGGSETAEARKMTVAQCTDRQRECGERCLKRAETKHGKESTDSLIDYNNCLHRTCQPQGASCRADAIDSKNDKRIVAAPRTTKIDPRVTTTSQDLVKQGRGDGRIPVTDNVSSAPRVTRDHRGWTGAPQGGVTVGPSNVRDHRTPKPNPNRGGGKPR